MLISPLTYINFINECYIFKGEIFAIWQILPYEGIFFTFIEKKHVCYHFTFCIIIILEIINFLYIIINHIYIYCMHI